MEFTGERFIPGETDIELQLEHMNRYQFARQFVENKRVLDAACGVGYGSDLLARDAEHVVGIDISEECIIYAQEKYAGKRVTFLSASIESLPFKNKTFDIVVSFETLEHVDEIIQAKFLKEIVRVLTDDGILIISTPNHSIYQKRGVNTFHIKELGYIEFKQALEKNFQTIKFFSQQFEVCNTISGAKSGSAWIESEQAVQEAEYLIAVCSNHELASVNGRVIIRNDKKLEQLTEWAISNHKRNEKNNEHICELDLQIKQMEKEHRAYIARNAQSMEQLQRMTAKIKQLQYERQEYEAEHTRNTEQLYLLGVKIKQLKEECQRYLTENAEKNEQIHSLKADIEQLEKLAQTYIARNKYDKDRIHQLEGECLQYAQELKRNDAEYQKLVMDSVAKEREWQQTLRNKEGHIEQLLIVDRELARIKSSRSWRYMGYVWKVRDFIAPLGSKRRLFIKMSVKFVKHPISFLHKLTPGRIGKFFRTLHREGALSVSRRLDDCLIGTKINAQIIDMVSVDFSPEKTAADYAPLTVPQWETPQISILIPAYNQFDFTYQCIRSILENSGEVSYEILLADDCSNDLTKEIDQIISGLVWVRNLNNLQFLRNCNNAAKLAKGQYILFLNNDTQVQKEWLAPLVELMERDSRIGMVGSKLIYPDGRLQEAGGILWNDGSAWNYGNRSDPALPEFNYVKEADYISGASILIRKSLWEEIGGFDERFIPAYCEDSDLAFSVRKRGYKVMYQPLSAVVHFEGISHGTDLKSGQKAYQLSNQQKFFQKWKDILQEEQFPNAEHVFLARERGKNQKILLMIDHYVPQYDKDAGSRTVFEYLKLFVSNGFHVKFIGDNFYPHEPYTKTLQQMGVEVLYGPYFANHWKEWLGENGPDIDYVFLNRPHISVKYIDELRSKTHARIIYYGHDLHFLREFREYELTGERSVLKSSEEWKQRELSLMRKADVTYYPSFVEVEEIHKIAPEVPVRAIPAYLFEQVEPIAYNAAQRQHVMFIGGFGHRPNVDAVKWLSQEIMPELKRLLPDLIVHILGSNPPEEITSLECAQIKIHGFVTEEQLKSFYQSCRIAIVPLRYGAGVKGKVVEAMRYGMPVVTTAIGAEGLAGAGEILCIADTAAEFAQKTAELYEDRHALEEKSRASIAYVRKNFSPQNAVAIIGDDFDMRG